MISISEKTKCGIAELINKYGNADYDRFISQKNFFYFYHLSSLRHAVLGWYPFPKSGEVLEIGAGFGALTGLFLEEFGHVDVIESDEFSFDCLKRRFAAEDINAFCTGLDAYKTEKKYDWIFVIDSDILYRRNLDTIMQIVKGLLKETGTAVFGFRNKRGAKYTCGALDEYVTEPFDTERLIGAEQFSETAKRFFNRINYYYPFPDHVYTQAVFSDSDMPKESIRDRVMPMDPFSSPVIKFENDEYDKAIADGCLNKISNFCLAFMKNGDEDNINVKRAILSYDRGIRSYKTVFLNNDTVVKSPIKREGIINLKRSFDNLEELKSRGLLTVPQEFEESSIIMPRIRDKTLLDAIGQYAETKDQNGIIDLFKQMYANILRSSDTDSSGYDERKWGVPLDEAGTILRTGFIDLIPYNAFYTDQGIMYYDQEFAEEYCPSKYIHFRAIHYTYIHIGQLENVIKEADMYRLFDIDAEMKEAFERYENKFVEDNRNWSLYSAMYGWVYGISIDRIEANRKKLMDE